MTTFKKMAGLFKELKGIKTSAVTEKVKPLMVEFARKQFVSSGSYGGKRWAMYASEPKYEAYKMAMGATMAPLRWSPSLERLEPALTSPSSPFVRWGKFTNKATMTVLLDYYNELQKGGVNQFGERFPARPIFPRKSAAFQRDVIGGLKDTYLKKFRETIKKHRGKNDSNDRKEGRK